MMRKYPINKKFNMQISSLNYSAFFIFTINKKIISHHEVEYYNYKLTA